MKFSKTTSFLIIFMVFVLGYFVLDLLKSGENHSSDSDNLTVKNSEVKDSKKSFELQKTILFDFFKSDLDDKKLSAVVKDRIKNNEYDILWSQNYIIENISEYQVNEYGQYVNILYDVVFSKDSQYIWMQFSTRWKEDELLDITFQDIDYNRRIKTNEVKPGVEYFAGEAIEKMNSSLSNFGWRYQKEDPKINSSLTKVNILESKALGSNLTKDEAIVEVIYQTELQQVSNELTALLYMKEYDGKWQVEDISIVNLKQRDPDA